MKISIPKSGISIFTPRFPKPDYKRLLQRKKTKEKFLEEKKLLLKNIRKQGKADEKLVGKALSFVAGIASIPVTRSDRKLVEKAFSFSREKHSKQKRLSGEPYFSHAFHTAMILSEYGLDSNTIAAALLHDVLEDTDVSEEELEKLFGKEVLLLVKGVTKLQGETEDLELEEIGYLETLLVASSSDLRVMLIKLADKIHNLRTIKFLPADRRKEISRNALEVYAPLADKFGLQLMREEIEDLAFKELYPKEFAKTVKEAQKKRKKQEKEIDTTIKVLSKQKVKGRKKFSDVFSFRKQQRSYYYSFQKFRKERLEEYNDSVSLVILGKSIQDCYEALTTTHSLFFPVPGALNDFIASPKHLTYQSIETTVVGPRGNAINVLIRTKEMDELALRGITVWLAEKEKIELAGKQAAAFSEISRISAGGEDFVSVLKSDFLEEQISVFGPKGEKVSLPKGSTPIDFVFKVQPEKAVRAAHIEVNGFPRPVWYTLKSGDRISAVFSPVKTIHREWLDFANTFYAREMIKEELSIHGKPAQKTKVKIHFSAPQRKTLLSEISSVIMHHNAELNALEMKRVSKNELDGTIEMSIKKKGVARELIESIHKIRGLKEKN